MSLDDIKMKSTDFLQTTHLDSGGFGKVSLCHHRIHGLVILKNVYTGPKCTEYNESLLEEGKMMHRLNHNRVVKLLGVIIEDGNYSLVMEYMEKGNLMQVLKGEVENSDAHFIDADVVVDMVISVVVFCSFAFVNC